MKQCTVFSLVLLVVSVTELIAGDVTPNEQSEILLVRRILLCCVKNVWLATGRIRIRLKVRSIFDL